LIGFVLFIKLGLKLIPTVQKSFQGNVWEGRSHC